MLSLATFDQQAMTVEAIASTFAEVARRDKQGTYLERLDPTGLDTSTLVGAPVLDSHRQGTSRDVIGVITAHRFEAKNLIVTIRLSMTDCQSARKTAPFRRPILPPYAVSRSGPEPTELITE